VAGLLDSSFASSGVTMNLDLILRNAEILTLDDEHPRARSLGVWQGLVVGLDDDLADVTADRYVDLQGATVVPGFNDAHNHMAWFGLSFDEIDLSGVNGTTELCDLLASRAASLPTGEWVIGTGYDHSSLGQHPTRELLDKVSDSHPIWVKHRSGHMCAVNTVILERLDIIDVNAQGPPGGVIRRDRNGVPTGLLEEHAQELVASLVLPYPVERLSRAIARASHQYLQEGITSVTEAGVGGGFIGKSPIEIAAYQIARDAGKLGVRVQLMVSSEVLHPVNAALLDDAQIGIDLGIRTGFGDEWLSIGAVKIFMDGSLVGKTAAMSEPYEGQSSERGYLLGAAEKLEDLIVNAHCAGWQIAMHAIGDSAIDVALKAIEKAQRELPRPDARHRIEHCAIVRPDQIDRIAAARVVPVPQARFIAELGDTILAAVGPKRATWAYRHRSFLSAGITVPGSSDRPVVTGQPLLGIQSMVERLTASGILLGAEELVAPIEALRAYTWAPAYAANHDHHKGTLRPGMLADMAVLDGDPTKVDASRIGQINVLATFVDGRLVYDKHHLYRIDSG
jgi:predicted amidohydrolase YtcJ